MSRWYELAIKELSSEIERLLHIMKSSGLSYHNPEAEQYLTLALLSVKNDNHERLNRLESALVEIQSHIGYLEEQIQEATEPF